MPRATSPEKVKEILGLRLTGFSNIEIEKRTGVKRRTVRNVLQRFEKRVEEDGLMEASRYHGVELKVKQLFDLAANLKENDNLNVVDCSIGFSTAKLLDGLNVDLSKVKGFLDDIYFESMNQGLTGADVAVTLVLMDAARKETGRSFNQIAKDHQQLNLEVAQLRDELKGLERQIPVTRETLKKETQDAKATRKELTRFKETREYLETLGLDMEDYEKMGALVGNLKNRDYDAEKLVEFYGSSNKLEERKSLVETSVNSLETRENELSEKVTGLEEMLSERSCTVDSIRLLEGQKLEPEDVRTITETVVSLSTHLGLTPREAIEHLTQELREHYTPLFSLKDQLERREARLKIIEAKLEEKQSSLKSVSEIYEAKRKELDDLNFLYEIGVKKEELHTWKDILNTLKTDISTFKREMTKLGGIQSYTEERTIELKELDRNVERLKEMRENLESDIRILSSQLVEEVENNLARTKGILDIFREEFLSPETGFKDQTVAVLNEVKIKIIETLAGLSSSLEVKLGNLDGKLKEFEGTVDEAANRVYETGKEIGRQWNFEVLRKIIMSEEVDMLDAIAVMTVIVEAFESMLRRKREEELLSSCLNFRLALGKRFERVYR